MTRENIFKLLDIPPEFDLPDEDKTDDILDHLDLWKDDSNQALRKLLSLTTANDSDDEKLETIFYVSPFIADESWTSKVHLKVAEDIIESLKPIPREILSRLLSERIRPVFSAGLHPLINLESGRKLPRPAGGNNSSIDIYIDQPWKKTLGLCSIVTCIITLLEVGDLERTWHLLTPPMMTLLDDHHPKWRRRALALVSALLVLAPSDLLRRTGLQGLLSASLNNSLLFTHHPESSLLVRDAIPLFLTLAVKTTKQGSEERFKELCGLLGGTIIGTLWVTATRDKGITQVTYESLPAIVKTLRIGTVRYLSAIIPQLSSSIIPHPAEVLDEPLMIAALKAFPSIIEQCAPRMHHWKFDILDPILRRWVIMRDDKISDQDGKAIYDELKNVCRCLEAVVPEIREDDFKVLLETDREMFGELLG